MEQAHGRPILEFGFNETGTTATSTGSSTPTLTLKDATQTDGDLHSAPGLGVAGDITGNARFGTDRAFDNTASFATTGRTGGIALNTTDNSVTTLSSWTVSGWYKTDVGTILNGGGTVLFQSPITFSALPDGSPGISTAGFAVRAENPNGLRVTVNGINTGVGSAGNTWTDEAKWVFFAVTYDGTQSVANIRYYRGYRNAAEAGANPAGVTQVAFDTIAQGTTLPAHGLAIGNRTEDYNRAFDGFLDNMRVFGARDNSPGGALSLTQLEILRAGDITAGPDFTADFNQDSYVDGADFLTWQRGFGEGTTLADGDANHDGVVDATDLQIFNLQLGTAPPMPPSAAVPEPGAWFVLSVAALSTPRHRKMARRVREVAGGRRC
jgi:hypothetical protein